MIESNGARRIAPWSSALGRVSMLMLIIALSACGGGGGGGSPAPNPPPPPPPPAPAPGPNAGLTVSAAESSVAAGGHAVALHASVSNSSAVPSWTLNGPGTLSAASGTDVSYVPPDTESLDNADTATVSVTIPSVAAQQVKLALTPVDLPGHHWSSARDAILGFRHVTYGAGAYLATGGDNRLWRSVDGASWSAQAIGPSGSQAEIFNEIASDDGLMAIAYSGNVYTSSDGLAWTLASTAVLPLDQGGLGLVAGNHVFLHYAYDATQVSTDGGVHWTSVTSTFRAVTFGNGQFLGEDDAGALWASTDGIHWTAGARLGQVYGLAFADGDFGAVTNGSFSVSGDDGTWIGSAQPLLVNGALMGAGTGFSQASGFASSFPGALSHEVAGQLWGSASFPVGYAVPNDIAHGPQGWVGVSQEGWISDSVDGATWSTAVEGSYGDLTAVDDFAGTYVAVSDLGFALTSTDAQHWSHTLLPTMPDGSMMPAHGLAHGNGVLVATGFRDTTLLSGQPGTPIGIAWFSTDGQIWHAVPNPATGEALTSVSFDGQRFIAPGSSGGVYASPDGHAWSRLGSVSSAAPWISKIAYGGGAYVAIGRQGLLARSTDGANWTVLPAFAPADPNSSAKVSTLSDVLWDGGQFLVVGSDYTRATSPDGAAWTQGRIDRAPPPAALARCGSVLVGVGFGSVITSVDFSTWATRVWSNTPVLSAVTCGDGRVVAVGMNDAIMVSDH